MHCASCDGYFIINVPHLSVFSGLGKVVLHDNIIYLVSSYIVFFVLFWTVGNVCASTGFYKYLTVALILIHFRVHNIYNCSAA